MPRLEEVLGQARFPLFALHPDRWDGTALVGVVGREDGLAGVHTVQLLYTDLEGSSGLLVSNIAARAAVGARARHRDRLYLHLESFVRTFPPPGGGRWFTGAAVVDSHDFRVHRRLGMIAGVERALDRLTHDRFPLEVFDTAVREGDGVTDLVVAGWEQPVAALARDLQPVTPALAAAFDAAAVS